MSLLPYDIGAVEVEAAWRSRLAWPLAQAERSALLLRQLRALRTFIGGLTDRPMRGIAELAAHGLIAEVRPIALGALELARAKDSGQSLVGGPPMFRYLVGELDTPPPIPDLRARLDAEVPRRAALQRLARAASWTPLTRLPAAWLTPRATAVSHNALLRQMAGGADFAVGYDHAPAVLARCLDGGAGGTPPDTTGLAAKLADALMADFDLVDPYRARAARLIDDLCRAHLALAAEVVHALGRARRLPRLIWSGTGGKFAARALGQEALRRDGEAVRFDHGGSSGTIDAGDALCLTELAVSSRFITSTPLQAAAVADLTASLVAPDRRIEIIGAGGDPDLRRVAAIRRAARPARPRVVYAASAFFGFRAVYPVALPDPIYLDWQMRLVEQLKALPLTLICKPHPLGVARGRRHPLAELADTRSEPFESLIAETDVFVFDYPQSTTFWEALCTDRRVVLIDVGVGGFSATARPMIERRCRVLTAHPDERQRPHIASDQLAAALFDPPDADPSECRAFFCGSA